MPLSDDNEIDSLVKNNFVFLVDNFYFFCFSLTAQCTVPTFTSELSSGCTAESMVDHDSTCTYTCSGGFSLVGDATITCSSGSFSALPPTCEGREKQFICPSQI